jgi:lipopolysaccharide/colanic/teichoic acid biosynthesis glycosyltransferase
LASTAEAELFWSIDQRYWDRHVIKPGITGLAQVQGYRGATLTRADLTNRLQADLDYLAGWTIWKDIKIIAKTFAVISHKNAF